MNNKVKLVRVSKDLQQKDLALEVGISRQTLSLIEKGKYNPSLKLCVNIAEALDSDLNSLFWKV
ncbi:helix-turn-helix transcriptional regulator [Apilactobacillus timberlakei]|uniref:Transcriptional regulator n=1 Tax=Apilactobacillus timberlakei TaxID=2008380 RepID=A0ABY2YT05_9LACO|nr:helix-turn-helix transcriptional regulator [Apilactobacillus timberlakei]TPR13307.1 transcriptional regulator [Apilactobacillus timberlakei]TPR14352.1 transcriptional regulator [Apilactobacillus timberlakei]TPR16605.1 transcriptional regulator [Apilactobacillus timberlakei]